MASSHQRQAFTAYGTQRFQRNWLQGRLDEDRDVVAALARKEPNRPAFLSALAWIEAETGHPDKSRALLTRLFVDGVLLQGLNMILTLAVYAFFMWRIHPALTLA